MNYIPQISDVNGVGRYVEVLFGDNLGFHELGDVDQDGQDQNRYGVDQNSFGDWVSVDQIAM